MNKIALAATLLLASTAAAQTPREIPRAAMDTYFTRLESFGASGSVVVVRNGSVAYRRGFGWADRTKRIPMTTATGADIASMTKNLTAIAILQLEQRGSIKRTDSIAAHLDSVPEDKRAITIEQLITHRSGLPQFFIEGNDFAHITRSQALHAILEAKLEFAPGTDDGYSDAGYTLLAIIVEKLTGKPIEQVFDEEQFRRAGLTGTHSYGSPSLLTMKSLAHGYLGAEDHGSPAGYVKSENYWGVKGAGGVISTADDIAAWEIALARGELVRGSPYADGLFGEVVPLPSGQHGWVRTGAQDFGFAAGVIRYSSDSTIAVVTINRQPEAMDVSNIRNRLLGDLDAFLFGTPPAMPPATNGFTAPASVARSEHILADGSRIRIDRDDEGFLFTPDGPLAVELLSYAGDTTGRAARLNLASRTLTLVNKLCQGDPGPLRAALTRPSERLENYIRTASCGDSVSRIHVVGSIPKWWPTASTASPVTLIEIVRPARTTRFRFEWEGDRIAAVGGDAIMVPVTRFVSSTNRDEYLGFHLGIRSPVKARISHTAEQTTLQLVEGNNIHRAR